MPLFDNAGTIDELLGQTGKGDKLLGKWGDVPHLIQHLDAADLTLAQRRVLRAAFKLNCIAEERTQIRSPADSYQSLKYLAGEAQEHFVVQALDTRNHIIATTTVYIGSVNTSVIRIAEVLRPAIVNHCPAIILAHNHPSGDPSPSPEDVSVTRQIISAAKQMDIEVLDHIVIGADRFVSLKERGLGFGDDNTHALREVPVALNTSDEDADEWDPSNDDTINDFDPAEEGEETFTEDELDAMDIDELCDIAEENPETGVVEIPAWRVKPNPVIGQ